MTTTAASPHGFLHPAGWKPPKGYANGVIAEGRMVFLGGHIGWNAQQEFETDDFVGQVRQALTTIRTLLAEAGAGPEHLVRLTWYILDKREYLARLPEMGAVYREVLGKNFPAMAMVVVAGLIEDRAKVEIEATAVVPWA
jgi:enamine deaminase RidA (YjgF/YER057c/UK114 family)